MSGYRTLHRESLGSFPIWHLLTTTSSSREDSSTSRGTSATASASTTITNTTASCWRLWAACGDGAIRCYLMKEKSLHNNNSNNKNDNNDDNNDNDDDNAILDASACQCILTHILKPSDDDDETNNKQQGTVVMTPGYSQVQVIELKQQEQEQEQDKQENNDDDDDIDGDTQQCIFVVLAMSMAGTIHVYKLQNDYNMKLQTQTHNTKDKTKDYTQQVAPDYEFTVEHATGTCMRLCPNNPNNDNDNDDNRTIRVAVPCLDGTVAIVSTGISQQKTKRNESSSSVPTPAGTVIQRYSSPIQQPPLSESTTTTTTTRPNNNNNIVMSMDWHPHRPNLLAVGRRDGLVELLSSSSSSSSSPNTDNDQPYYYYHRLVHHEAPLRTLAFTPDGHLLATCSDDGMLCLWDMSRQHPQRPQQQPPPVLVNHVTQAHASWIFQCVALPDSRRFVTTGADSKIHVWKVDELAKGPVHTFTSGSGGGGGGGIRPWPSEQKSNLNNDTTTANNNTTTAAAVNADGSQDDTVDTNSSKTTMDGGCVWTIACQQQQRQQQKSIAKSSSVVAPRLISGSERGEIQIYGTAHGNMPFVPKELRSTPTFTSTTKTTITTTTTTPSQPVSAIPAVVVAASELVPGETRIQDSDGFIGTVAYVGPVASSKSPNEIYAGIVWDDESRGKHDGSVICRQTNTIVRHFSCNRPNQGSFLKLKMINVGGPLTTSLLKSKYVDRDAPIIAPNNVLPHTATTSTGRELPIEFLGELKIRERQQLQDVDKISLRRSGISRAADDDEQFQEYHQIKEIDLAGNLLCQWFQVLKIMRQFPQLEHFSIAYNFVRNVTSIQNNPVLFGITFDRIKVLNLNHCAITSFETIQWIADTMPNIESLCVANNDLSDLSTLQVMIGLEKLQRLDCSNCHFESWHDQVSKFGTLPNLEWLSLDDNPIPCIPMDAGVSSSFPQLTSLQISGTAISDWMDLEGIQSFGKLKVLRIKNLPLTAELGQAEVRSMCIARYPQLELLNGSIVSQLERVEAEKRYVAMVSHLLQRCHLDENESIQEQDVLAQHPRFVELKEKYHTLVISNNKNKNNSITGGDNLAASVYNVTVRSLAPSSCTMEPIRRRLPGTITVERLKALCSRRFGGLDYDLIRLRFRNDGDSLPVELDDDEKALNYYGLNDGAEIWMDEVDVVEQEHQRELEHLEQERRIAQHDRTIQAMKELKRMG
ncbi:WD-40 repeat-containing serine/threonine protein kinase [Nitzschia inconspicua]|uniref:WD-40 repeat-containing serine/threonine protein kinase n=1 Tax=Nitzschia inconspicua TaxID=303405 RepID=A0A9K3KHE8_9STRA|nr:WD-40 repeat-containing serine/threonine protein kinase [Nitzschia inconspicua]